MQVAKRVELNVLHVERRVDFVRTESASEDVVDLKAKKLRVEVAGAVAKQIVEQMKRFYESLC